MQPVLGEYLDDYPEIPILLRGDSGFSTPDLYNQCEENGTSYVIWLKENVFFPLVNPHLYEVGWILGFSVIPNLHTSL